MNNVIPFRGKRQHNTILEMHILCHTPDFEAACDMAAALEREYRVACHPMICDLESVHPGEVMLLEFHGDRVESTPIWIDYDGDDDEGDK